METSQPASLSGLYILQMNTEKTVLHICAQIHKINVSEVTAQNCRNGCKLEEPGML